MTKTDTSRILQLTGILTETSTLPQLLAAMAPERVTTGLQSLGMLSLRTLARTFKTDSTDVVEVIRDVLVQQEPDGPTARTLLGLTVLELVDRGEPDEARRRFEDIEDGLQGLLDINIFLLRFLSRKTGKPVADVLSAMGQATRALEALRR
jgi:hypothetical protein